MKKTLLLATHNKDKVREIAAILSECGLTGWHVVSLDELGVPDDVEETGTTFEENAMIKARAAAGRDYVVAADDSGLEVDALGGAPGVYSARYSGVHGNDDANNEKLLAELASVPETRRTARYVCAMACILPDGTSWCHRATCEGRIGTALTGRGGFGYDPLFFPDGFDRTFGEVGAEEKNAISHRGKAVRAMAAWLKEREEDHAQQ